jgi:hypothetical protein
MMIKAFEELLLRRLSREMAVIGRNPEAQAISVS